METVKESGKSRDPEKHGSVRKEGNSTVGLWNMSKLIGGEGGGGAGEGVLPELRDQGRACLLNPLFALYPGVCLLWFHS